MGQQVSVVEKPSPRRGVVKYELNRSLTGMGHEHFASMKDAVGPRPAAVLARQLLATGQVDSVYMYGNIVTIDISKGYTADGLSDVVRNMYQFWKPGMEMPTFDAPAEGDVSGDLAPSRRNDAGSRSSQQSAASFEYYAGSRRDLC